MKIPAVPAMMPWARDVEARLGVLEGAVPGTPTQDRMSFIDGIPEYMVAPAGAGGWGVLSDAISVFANTSTGLLKVTLSAFWKGSVPGGGNAAAVGAMICLLNGKLDYPDDLDATSRAGLCFSINAVAGTGNGLSGSGSLVRVFKVTPGSYNLRVGYMYQNVTDGINLMWSNRSILVEQV